MGMAASQVRLLQLTERKNDIGYQLTMLSNQKMSLTRDMQRVSREYQNGLNSKMLKWSNNGGVTQIDLSYKNIMTPSLMNQNKAYLLTDLSNKVVINGQYEKYAKMISPNGQPGGDWESVRDEVLAELTGVDVTTVSNYNNYQDAIYKNEAALDELKEDKVNIPTRSTTTGTFVAKAGTISGYDISELYSSAGTISIGGADRAASNIKNITEKLGKQLGQYLKTPEKFEKACAAWANEYTGLISNGNIDPEKGASALKGDSSNYTINVKTMVDEIIGKYSAEGGSVKIDSTTNKTEVEWLDIDSDTYKKRAEAQEKWQSEYDNATEEYNNAVSNKNTALTSNQEKMLQFYDTLFSSIAEKGWTYNSEVDDNDYLNDMLQNNIYTLTTVDRGAEYNGNGDEFVLSNKYETDIASNFTNIVMVNDSDAREEALIKYENEKAIINAKESRIDTKMQDLQTEQAAVSQMIQSIDKQKSDNIDRTFNIFS